MRSFADNQNNHSFNLDSVNEMTRKFHVTQFPKEMHKVYSTCKKVKDWESLKDAFIEKKVDNWTKSDELKVQNELYKYKMSEIDAKAPSDYEIKETEYQSKFPQDWRNMKNL